MKLQEYVHNKEAEEKIKLTQKLKKEHPDWSDDAIWVAATMKVNEWRMERL